MAAFYSQDGLHVAYHVDNSSDRVLKYATWDGEKWVSQKISSETTVSIKSVSLAFGKNDTPYVLYRASTESNNVIKLATIQDSRWIINSAPLQAQEVDNCGNIVCDSRGDVHFICSERYYQGQAYTYRLRYLSYSGEEWDSKNLVSDVNLDALCKLVLDQNDNPHFTYNVNLGEGKYATCQGGNWQIVSLSPSVKAGSLAIDQKGDLHLSIRMNSAGRYLTDLYYATSSGKMLILCSPTNLMVIGIVIVIVLVIVTLLVWQKKHPKIKQNLFLDTNRKT
jgi:hypothetical protein